MKYIDLNLEKIEKDDRKKYILNNVVEENKISIILGSPGSGKTSLLEKYKSDYNFCEIHPIKNFLKLNKKINSNTKVLLLDGLDEYRYNENDKHFVIVELGNKISKLIDENSEIKVVITCREMDWYGENDEYSLKEEIPDKNIGVFKVLPLDIEKQNEILDIFRISDKTKFLNDFKDKDFLTNPQLLKMIIELWKKGEINVLSKRDLYTKFINLAKENNFKRRNNYDEKTRLKVIGYLAFFYIFSKVDEFSNELIDEIIDNENGYTRDMIEFILNTSLFENKVFSHRTIAEFTLAQFICDYKFEDELNQNKIKELFIKKGRIPTDLRGTYSWLCSLSKDSNLIQIDPYYQVLYGDNLFCSLNEKKEIIKAVKKYSELNPYFLNWRYNNNLENFYSKELDDFLIKELEVALILNNHYIYFVVYILISGDNLSDKIKKKIKEIIYEKDLENNYKLFMISALKSDEKILFEILDNIEKKFIIDEKEAMKIKILTFLYPNYINSKDIINYIKLDSKNNFNAEPYFFLNQTPLEEKFDLVIEILKKHENLMEDNEIDGKVNRFIEDFISGCLKQYYKEKKYKELYNTIKKTKEFFSDYYTIFDKKNLIFSNIRQDNKLDLLAVELFKLFIEENLLKLFSLNRRIIFEFRYFYNASYFLNKDKVILSFMNLKKEKELNLYLFKEAFSSGEIEKDLTLYQNIAKEYSFEEDFFKMINPPKDIYVQEYEEENKKYEEKKLLKKNKNELLISSKTDEEILNNFSILNKISNYVYFKEEIIEDFEINTFERLKKILKKLIFTDLNKEIMTLDEVIKKSPEFMRAIDNVYYSSLVLNNDNTEIIAELKNLELKKYLYIFSIKNKDIGGISKSNFDEKIELSNEQFAYDAILEFLNNYIGNKININIFEDYIKDKSLNTLRKFVWKARNDFNIFIEEFINYFFVDIKIKDLEELEKLELNINNQNKMSVLQKFYNNKELDMDESLIFFDILNYDRLENFENFKKLYSSKKIQILQNLMKNFNTEKSLEEPNGFITLKMECASFLKYKAFYMLSKEELMELIKFYNYDNNIWKNRILNRISEENQKESDNLFDNYPVNTLKQYILRDTIVSKKDFFNEVVYGFNRLKKEIEDNVDNEKNAFYSDKNNCKREEDCRDILLNLLKRRYEKSWEINKEKYEGDNRVDMHIQYRSNLNFKVQIECKVDDHKELFRGINNQLIEKYFSSGVQFGIYLVFYFGKLNPKGRKNKEEMLSQLKKDITNQYKENIEIICIDLRK